MIYILSHRSRYHVDTLEVQYVRQFEVVRRFLAEMVSKYYRQCRNMYHGDSF